MQRVTAQVLRTYLTALTAVAMFAGCAGGGIGASGGTGEPQGPLGAFAQTGGNALAGEYSGQAVDTTFGSGKLKAAFAQAKSAVGGSVTTTFQKTSITFSLAGTYANASVSGVDVGTIDKKACAFSYHGKYDASTHTLSVTYQSAHGCSGEGGTFTMKKGCYYQENLMQVPGEPSDVRQTRPDAGGLHSC